MCILIHIFNAIVNVCIIIAHSHYICEHKYWLTGFSWYIYIMRAETSKKYIFYFQSDKRIFKYDNLVFTFRGFTSGHWPLLIWNYVPLLFSFNMNVGYQITIPFLRISRAISDRSRLVETGDNILYQTYFAYTYMAELMNFRP